MPLCLLILSVCVCVCTLQFIEELLHCCFELVAGCCICITITASLLFNSKLIVVYQFSNKCTYFMYGTVWFGILILVASYHNLFRSSFGFWFRFGRACTFIIRFVFRPPIIPRANLLQLRCATQTCQCICCRCVLGCSSSSSHSNIALYVLRITSCGPKEVELWLIQRN